MTVPVCRLLPVLFLLTTGTIGARVSQRLIGGHAKVDTPATNKADDAPEEKKTLSQQVAEGKYALIQTELFEKPPKRPGVISYEKNSEVPKDDENSLGGLGPDDIWLAEDHLLVLKGGSFHRTASELPWPPIDDYRAPDRQVKIPSQPKVPPPFPVQLAEGGPLQLLGVNFTGAINGSFTIPGTDGAPPYLLPPPYKDPTNASAGGAPYPLPPYPFLPENFNRGNGPGPFPFPSPPPNLNQSLDEDDPSIYYPPPYSFFYPTDNSSQVPPGPLVPGIVLPPPPNFFGALNPPATTTTTTPSPPRTRPSTTKHPAQYHSHDDKPLSPPSIAPTRNDERPLNTPNHVTHPPTRYLPYDNKPQGKPIRPTINYHENELPPERSSPNPRVAPINPTLQIPFNENDLPPTNSEVDEVPHRNVQYFQHPKNTYRQQQQTTTNAPLQPHFLGSYNQSDQRPKLKLHPSPVHQTTTPRVQNFNQYYEPSRTMVPPFIPTVPTLRVIQVPRTYLRPTSVPVVSNTLSNIYNRRERPYLQPTSSPMHAGNTLSPVPVLQAPYEDDRTYIKPTSRPNTNSKLLPVHYLPYNNQGRPTAVIPPAHTVSSVQYRAPPRTRVSSTTVPLKGYFSSVDVDTNSVQPQADYYFYGEDSTAPPPRSRLQGRSNFDKHVQVLQQQIQSYLKPSSQPVYEYSFQAANYRPTTPRHEYRNPAPQNQYLKPHPAPDRYQAHRQNYYPKQDDRYLDDITKNYFTMFGQKITTPVTPSVSLAGDTLVNYRKPRPSINPSLSLAGDTLVNYRKPRPPINPDAELVQINPHQKQHRPGGPGTFISYQLPGNGAHFYFLTPQLVQQQRQQEQEQSQRAYYYPKPESGRVPRRNHR